MDIMAAFVIVILFFDSIRLCEPAPRGAGLKEGSLPAQGGKARRKTDV